ncbi:MAG: hypothetical protein V2A73_15740 [Pseudomonadota bacterium]
MKTMRSSRFLSFLAAAGFSILGGLVFAQDAPSAPVDEQNPAEPAPATAETAAMTPQQMLAQASEYTTKMQEFMKRVIQLQEVARRNKDVIKLNCVNDKLLQVKQLLNIAESANINLQEAIARNDEDTRHHEFGRITIAYQQATVIGTEAENCIGEDLTFLGPTTVTVEQPASSADDMGAPEHDMDYPPVEAPPVASPYI